MWPRKKKQSVSRAEADDPRDPHSERTDAPGDGDGPPTEAVPADQALDFLAELLRGYGEGAFDLGAEDADEIAARFEAWARHLLVGTPPPPRRGGETGDEGQASPAEPRSRRDLPGLRQAFRRHRKAEHDYVTRSLGDFRAATWSFVSGLRRSLQTEQASDRRLGHRLRRLEGAVRAGNPGSIKSEARETVEHLTHFLAERGERHQAQITEMASRLELLREELDQERAKATTCPVTGIFNRAAFDEQIEREVDLATLLGRRGCLLMVDIDHFKWVNDTHGHPAGDKALRCVADTLARCFMRKDDFLARFGGEEFAVVLRDVDAPMAMELAERCMTAIRNLEVVLGDEAAEADAATSLRLTVSMGVARLRLGETAESWIERADRALYQAKDAGRDRIVGDPVDLDDAQPTAPGE